MEISQLNTSEMATTTNQARYALADLQGQNSLAREVFRQTGIPTESPAAHA